MLPGPATSPQRCDVLVVVDILSFSTSLSVAVERGAEVWPYALGSDGAEQLAREIGAVLARGRSTRQGPTLSPASLLDLEPGTPAGAAVAQRVGDRARGGQRRAAGRLGVPARRVGGGRGCCVRTTASAWSRPGSAGRTARCVRRTRTCSARACVAAGLVAAGYRPSPDAAAAVAASVHPRPLADCPSGVELVERGFAEDVAMSQARDVTDVVAVMKSGRFSASH